MPDMELFVDFGAASNLTQNLNDAVEIDNEWAHPTIGVHVIPPTGATVAFEATFDGTNWVALSLRSISLAYFKQSTTSTDDFIGSIIGARKIRFRVSSGGSAAGTVMGRIQSTVGIVEGIAANLSTHNAQDYAVSVAFNESASAPTAATWYLKRQWAVPSATMFRPKKVESIVTTAGSQTLICSGIKMGSFDVSSNVFTDGSAVVSPRYYSRLFAIVTTVLSATPTNVTVTYTDNLGNTSHATAALTIPASAPVGNCFEFVLASTTGQMRDNGIIDITSVSDSANPTGVIEFWAVNTLMQTLGVANAYETCALDGITMQNPENVLIMLQQAATTAQQRGAGIVGSIASS